MVVNHLKSKGSSCEADGDPNLDDGQGNCNQTRTNAAAAIADWVATDPTNSNDTDYLIIGDLNAYEPALLDYNLEHGRNPALFDANSPYRASDHDPVVIGLDLTD